MADQSPEEMIAALDAIIDNAYDLTKDANRDTLPPNVAQGLNLINAAYQLMDEVLEAMNIPDPDPGETPDPEDKTETAFRNLMGSSGR